MSGVTRNAVIASLSLPGTGRARHHGQDLGNGGVRDVALFAVENVMRSVFAWRGAHLHVGRVGTGFLFGQSEGGELLAVHQLRQPFFLLLFRSKEEQGANADRVMRVGENRGRGAARADLLEHLAILHLGKATAADFLRRGHAENADPAKAVDHFPRDIRLAVDRLGVEVFIQKLAKFGDGPIDLPLLRIGEARIGHGPVGHEVAEE